MPAPIRRNAVKAGPTFLIAKRGSAPRARDGLDNYFGLPIARPASPKAYGSGFISFLRRANPKATLLVIGAAIVFISDAAIYAYGLRKVRPA